MLTGTIPQPAVHLDVLHLPAGPLPLIRLSYPTRGELVEAREDFRAVAGSQPLTLEEWEAHGELLGAVVEWSGHPTLRWATRCQVDVGPEAVAIRCGRAWEAAARTSRRLGEFRKAFRGLCLLAFCEQDQVDSLYLIRTEV